MKFLRSIAAKFNPSRTPNTRQKGQAAEDLALQYLLTHGLLLVARNFKTPGRGGGEIDLIMRSPDGTLVFIEVRQRRSIAQGGAAASVTIFKQRRIVFAAKHYLTRLAACPPCRFDVLTVQGEGAETQIEWLKAAFEAHF